MRHTSSVLTVFLTTEEKLILGKRMGSNSNYDHLRTKKLDYNIRCSGSQSFHQHKVNIIKGGVHAQQRQISSQTSFNIICLPEDRRQWTKHTFCHFEDKGWPPP